MRCWQNDPDARQTFTELRNELEDMGTLLEVRLVMDMASCQFPSNQRCLIQMAPFLLYHQGSTTSIVKKNLSRDCFLCNFSLIRVSVYFSNSPLSLFDKGIG